ncbi:Uncharacterized conserved protein YeaO, DUF488 family [Oribacterium sp. KHPX15]|uniref:DUF488 domain-containing protein n=1 Tax=Oribacterium sp. KHPX15 TaxID=1855342 RepID=UPI0008994E0C|nr:DUF488 family protein [Oribacterium sp. KHPX15]SEA78106.1 Uncharacterized conserved protein YeaO, DUF488 family [Oribacterium sp. KHPX15]
MGSIKTKRIYKAPEVNDGIRILVDRLWPRGIKKESAAINAWEKGIAPSAELRKWFNHDPEKYPEFRRKYMEELDVSEDAERFLGFVNEHFRSTNITLLYSAKDEEHNNALVLRDWLARDKENKYES